ncbi:MAG: hypothetical protein COT24_04670 [Candidatus Kerfeldbacteria bacterium CG08_land_8_20_14_0_20_40_16]|uniref:Uncharacterized protein n=1 Tax=Candidatus Kerfeldbacteria bacterium CG08_land_8_20_14_0_20_40_16 TaxID=2014244 RepID=A0A2H0YUP3_9BACT|nr:MAG: hypothetical protein COT24_04670 [Candidatus Kerfeldbacteria bacterium CG08_land_8_20_14_0_20_40_16]
MKKKDIKQIRKEIAEVIEDNINPQFEDIRVQLEGVEKRLDGRIDGVEKRLERVDSQMVTKSYLDDKLADLEGGLITKLRKEDQKMNLLVEIMRRKSLLTKADVKLLDEFRIFPKTSAKQS